MIEGATLALGRAEARSVNGDAACKVQVPSKPARAQYWKHTRTKEGDLLALMETAIGAIGSISAERRGLLELLQTCSEEARQPECNQSGEITA